MVYLTLKGALRGFFKPVLSGFFVLGMFFVFGEESVLGQEPTVIWEYDEQAFEVNDLAVDQDGYIYSVTGWQNCPPNCDTPGEIHKISPSGEQVWTYIDSNFSFHEIVIDQTGHLYAGASSGWIHKLSTSGDFLWKNGYNRGSAITGMELDGEGNIFVINSSQVQKVDTSGFWSSRFILGQNTNGKDLALHNDLVYFVGSPKKVYKNNLYDIHDFSYWSDTLLNENVNAITVDEKGYIYTSSNDFSIPPGSINEEVHKIDTSGNVAWVYSAHNGSIKDLAVEEGGQLYTASTDSELHKLDSGGEPIWEFTSSEGGLGNVTLDDDGHIFISSGSKAFKLGFLEIQGAKSACEKDSLEYSVKNPLPYASYSWSCSGLARCSGSDTSTTVSFSDIDDDSTGKITLTRTVDGKSEKTSLTVDVHPKVEADFSREERCLSEGVQFSNNSSIASGSIAHYYWEFGDGTTAFGEAPSYQYNEGGQYMVSLKATSDKGCRDNHKEEIKVEDPGNMEINMPENPCQGKELNFSIDEKDLGEVKSYQWNMGDDTNMTGTSVSHTYQKPGIYKVSAVLTTDLGCQDTLSRELEVASGPEVDLDDPGPLCEGGETQFSFDAEQEVQPTWIFGDGTVSKQEKPIHAYDSAGSYSLTLEVVGEDNCAQTYLDTIEVLQPPDPSIRTEDTVFCEGDEPVFSSEYHEGHDYNWSVTGSGEIIEEEREKVRVKWPEADTAEIALTETTSEEEGACTSKDVQEVVIEPNPVPEVTGPINVCKNDRVAKYAFDRVEGKEYKWEVRGGTVIEESGDSLQVRWEEEGKLNLSAIDRRTHNDCSNEETLNTTLRSSPESEIQWSPTEDGLNLRAGAERMASYTWKAGDGTILEGPEAEHTYEKPGTYEAALIIEDEWGCQDTTMEEVPYMSTSTKGDCQMELNVFPNPFDNFFEVFFILEEEQEIEGSLYNLKGERVAGLIEPTTLESGGHLKTFKGDLESGLYWGRIYMGDEHCLFRVVKE